MVAQNAFERRPPTSELVFRNTDVVDVAKGPTRERLSGGIAKGMEAEVVK